jgi:hypothetical protein
MKKIFTIALASCLFAWTFAFEGIIEQTYTNPETQAQMTFKWYISGEDVRLDILNGEESMTIIPDFEALQLVLFGNKADANGDHWYSKTPLNDVVVNAPSVRLLEKTDSKFNGVPAREAKVMTDKGLMVVQYIDMPLNMKNMITFFAESVEFKAVSLAEDRGFPVSSVLMTSKDAIYTLQTKSVKEQSLDAKWFNVPSNYKLFTGIK